MSAAANCRRAAGVEPSAPALPPIKPELGLTDAALVAVYCFIKNFIGYVS